jgi:iron complex transport system substrate-binding protein
MPKILCAIVMLIAALIPSVIAAEYTLDIFGNANMDDTIDQKDIAYVEDVVRGTKAASNLTDANHDGKVDETDIEQIKQIINGTEKELYLVDASNRIVKLHIPVERIASSSMTESVSTCCALGAADKIVGIPDFLAGDKMKDYDIISLSHPELANLPIVGSPYYGTPNLEIVASLKPDLILVTYADADSVQKATGIPTISYPSTDETALALKGFKWLKMMGYILGREKRADELSNYLNDKMNEVSSITSKISDKDKPNVYLAFWGKLTNTPAFYGPVGIAGGRLVADEGTTGPYSKHMWQVSKEQVIKWNPDAIFVHRTVGESNSTYIKPEDILADSDLKSIKAVQNKAVYNTRTFLFGWDPAIGVVECFYMAKILHPEKFADLDVEKAGNEILKEVYGADGIWTSISKKFDLYGSN